MTRGDCFDGKHPLPSSLRLCFQVTKGEKRWKLLGRGKKKNIFRWRSFFILNKKGYLLDKTYNKSQISPNIGIFKMIFKWISGFFICQGMKFDLLIKQFLSELVLNGKPENWCSMSKFKLNSLPNMAPRSWRLSSYEGTYLGLIKEYTWCVQKN